MGEDCSKGELGFNHTDQGQPRMKTNTIAYYRYRHFYTLIKAGEAHKYGDNGLCALWLETAATWRYLIRCELRDRRHER